MFLYLSAISISYTLVNQLTIHQPCQCNPLHDHLSVCFFVNGYINNKLKLTAMLSFKGVFYGQHYYFQLIIQFISVALSLAIQPFSIDSQLGEWRKFCFGTLPQGEHPPKWLWESAVTIFIINFEMALTALGVNLPTKGWYVTSTA